MTANVERLLAEAANIHVASHLTARVAPSTKPQKPVAEAKAQEGVDPDPKLLADVRADIQAAGIARLTATTEFSAALTTFSKALKKYTGALADYEKATNRTEEIMDPHTAARVGRKGWPDWYEEVIQLIQKFNGEWMAKAPKMPDRSDFAPVYGIPQDSGTLKHLHR